MRPYHRICNPYSDPYTFSSYCRGQQARPIFDHSRSTSKCIYIIDVYPGTAPETIDPCQHRYRQIPQHSIVAHILLLCSSTADMIFHLTNLNMTAPASHVQSIFDPHTSSLYDLIRDSSDDHDQ